MLLVAQQSRCGILAAVAAAILREEIRIPSRLPLFQCRSLVVWLLKSWSFSTIRMKSDGLKTPVVSIAPSTRNPSIIGRKGGAGSSEDVCKDRDECHVGINSCDLAAATS